jgi:ribA/ribD-fused uncharacterized protein
MLNKKLNYTLIMSCFSLFALVSWNYPSASRHIIGTRPASTRDEFVPYGTRGPVDAQRQYVPAAPSSDAQRQYTPAASPRFSSSKQKNKISQLADRDGFIWFRDSKKNELTAFLANDYPSPIYIWNQHFACAEAAFQSARFIEDPRLMAQFRELNAKEAKALADKLSRTQRPDWYRAREGAMYEVLKAKFQQNPELADLLLATGAAYLVNYDKKDAFWGDGGDGKGANRLGHILMRIRSEMGGAGYEGKIPRKYQKFVK